MLYKPGDLNSIPGTHVKVKGGNRLQGDPRTSTHSVTCALSPALPPSWTHTNKYKIKKYFYYFNYVYMEVCAYVCAHKSKYPQRTEVSGPPGAGVTGNCKSSDVGVGNPTLVLRKSRMCP